MSTPISQLLGDEDPTDDMANQLMNQMNNNGMMNHTMDQAQIPPGSAFMNNPSQQYPMQQQQQEYNYPPEAFEDMIEELSYTQKLIKSIKLPLLVFFMILLASMPQVNRAITHFIPSLLQESGQMTILGIVLKAVMLTLVFALINFFL